MGLSAQRTGGSALPRSNVKANTPWQTASGAVPYGAPAVAAPQAAPAAPAGAAPAATHSGPMRPYQPSAYLNPMNGERAYTPDEAAKNAQIRAMAMSGANLPQTFENGLSRNWQRMSEADARARGGVMNGVGWIDQNGNADIWSDQIAPEFRQRLDAGRAALSNRPPSLAELRLAQEMALNQSRPDLLAENLNWGRNIFGGGS